MEIDNHTQKRTINETEENIYSPRRDSNLKKTKMSEKGWVRMQLYRGRIKSSNILRPHRNFIEDEHEFKHQNMSEKGRVRMQLNSLLPYFLIF